MEEDLDKIARLVKAKDDEYDITVKPVYQSTHKIVATKAKPTESQDELWREVLRPYYNSNSVELKNAIEGKKSRFRIERI